MIKVPKEYSMHLAGGKVNIVLPGLLNNRTDRKKTLGNFCLNVLFSDELIQKYQTEAKIKITHVSSNATDPIQSR